MAERDFSKYFLYRWRYVIGYSLIALLLTTLLVFAGLFLPGGISPQETTSVIRSEALDLSKPTSLAIANLPYYALQETIFTYLGISVFSIKLPSLILGLLSAVGLIVLLRRWFKRNIAVLASFIAISTGQFLFVSQLGAPSVLYIFWPVALLLLGTQITRVTKLRFLWKVLFVTVAALSLYTPLSVYPLLAIILAIIFHPHLRNAVRRLKKSRLIICGILFAVLIAPLIWFVVINPQLGLTLLGVPSTWPPDIGQNAVALLMQYFWFWEPSNTAVLTPVFGLGSALLIGLGLYRLILTRETTRSYLIIFWFICLIPVLLINPSFTTVTFLPSVLMLAAGLTSLIGYWYRLFPLNPYARVIGLIPIVILVSTLIVTGFARYAYGYHYGESVSQLFPKDLRLLPAESKQLIVSEDEKAFYTSLSKYREDLAIIDAPRGDTFTATREARQDYEGYRVDRIVTSPYSTDADRFYVYVKI